MPPLHEATLAERPVVTDTREAYLSAVAAIAGGHGPVAVDAERASGFRYSQRAYLIQVFRRGAGTFLFDPPAIGDFSDLAAAIQHEEWIIHAASQDLTCLREVGLDPERIFDTELAARLLGIPRVGLGTVVEELLGLHLAKEHSAADWSTRPLPESLAEVCGARRGAAGRPARQDGRAARPRRARPESRKRSSRRSGSAS